MDLPDEDNTLGYCGKLVKALYGIRDAAQNWETHYRQQLESFGFKNGLSSPCLFYHPQKQVRLVVHGDDFTFLGGEEELEWCKKIMKQSYEIKVRGILGPGPNDCKTIRILNRCAELKK